MLRFLTPRKTAKGGDDPWPGAVALGKAYLAQPLRHPQPGVQEAGEQCVRHVGLFVALSTFGLRATQVRQELGVYQWMTH